jgi:hypothetical protein
MVLSEAQFGNFMKSLFENKDPIVYAIVTITCEKEFIQKEFCLYMRIVFFENDKYYYLYWLQIKVSRK